MKKTALIILSFLALPTFAVQVKIADLSAAESESAYRAMTEVGEVFLASKNATAKTGNNIECLAFLNQNGEPKSYSCIVTAEIGKSGITN